MNKDVSKDIAPSAQARWAPALGSLFVSLLVAGVYYSVLLGALVDWWWTTSKYAHSLIIFPAIIYLIFVDREEIFQLSPTPSYFALLLVIPLNLSIPLFQYIDVQILAETALVLLLPTIVWLVLGSQVIRVIAIPLILVVTVAPIWELFSPFLTQVTASVAHASLNILGVPVFRDEMYLRIPEGVFEIAEGCGGFRYFISGLSLGLIFAQLNFRRISSQIFIVVAAVLLSILINWIRVMIVIWAGHITDMQHHYVHEHVTLGWYVFAVAFFLFFFLCNRFIEAPSAISSQNSIADGVHAGMGKLDSGKTNSKASFHLAIFAVGVCVLVPPLIVERLSVERQQEGRVVEFSEISGWAGPYAGQSHWKPKFVGATQEQLVTYRDGDTLIDVYFAYYRDQSQGKELVNFNNRISNKGWMTFHPKPRTLALETGPLNVERIRVESGIGDALIWRWYVVAGIETTNRKVAKILELKNLVSDQSNSLVIAVSARGYKGAESKLVSKIEDLLSKLYIPVFGFAVDQ